MSLTFGSVATLAEKFGGAVARKDPNTTAKLDRVAPRKVAPSLVTNTPCSASTLLTKASSQTLLEPARNVVTSEHGGGTAPTELTSSAEKVFLGYQQNFRAYLQKFQRLASASPKPSVLQSRESGGGRPVGDVPSFESPSTFRSCRPVARHLDFSKVNLSIAPRDDVNSDYGSHSSGSSAVSSPTGSPNAFNFLTPWTAVRDPSLWGAMPLHTSPVQQGEKFTERSRFSSDSSSVHDDTGASSQASSSDSALDSSGSESEVDTEVGELGEMSPATNAQRGRELRIIQRELLSMARAYPNTERGIAAGKLRAQNEKLFKAVGADITYRGAVRLMPGIRSMSTVRTA